MAGPFMLASEEAMHTPEYYRQVLISSSMDNVGGEDLLGMDNHHS
jgi:hypothetical protein